MLYTKRAHLKLQYNMHTKQTSKLQNLRTSPLSPTWETYQTDLSTSSRSGNLSPHSAGARYDPSQKVRSGLSGECYRTTVVCRRLQRDPLWPLVYSPSKSLRPISRLYKRWTARGDSWCYGAVLLDAIGVVKGRSNCHFIAASIGEEQIR